MISTKALASTVLGGILFVGGASAVQAADAASTLTMKPLHGISFDVGSQRAASYFVNKNGRCEVVLTLAETPDWDSAPRFVSTRFEATIGPGKSTRYNSHEGRAIEFACETAAQTMSVNEVDQQIAAGSDR